MPKVVRGNRPIPAFAENATPGERTVFGSINASDTIDDNLTEQFKRGWGALDTANVGIPQEDFAAVEYTVSLVNKMIAQQGILEWASGQDYYTGSIAKSPTGQLYISLSGNNQAPNIGNALTETAFWGDFANSGFPNLPTADGGYSLSVASGTVSWVNSDSRYALIGGNEQQVFDVADGTEDNHAVNLSQLNAAGTGITADQARAITANTNANSRQDTAINGKQNTLQAGANIDIVGNTISSTATGLTPAQAMLIQQNTDKVGITNAQAQAIIANSAKVGITNDQSAQIALIVGKQNTLIAGANITIDGDTISATSVDGVVGITPEQAQAIILNSAKVGISPTQISAIRLNTQKIGLTGAQATAIRVNSDKVGITQAQVNTITANRDGLNTKQATLNAGTGIIIDQNTSTISATGGSTAGYDDTAIRTLIGDNTSAILLKQNTLNASQLSVINANPFTDDKQSDVARNSAKVGITSVQSTAITTNTAKRTYPQADRTKLATIAENATANATNAFLLNRENATGLQAILTIRGLQEALNEAGTTPANVAVLNNIGFANGKLTYNGNTVDTTIAQRDVLNILTSTSTVVSLSAAQGRVLKRLIDSLTTMVQANNDKVGITQGQANAITANTAKNGVTPAQARAITLNTAKRGITSTQSNAITANSAKEGITQGQSSAIIANTEKVGITNSQSSAITTNTAKVGITQAQASAITANTDKVSLSELTAGNNITITGNVISASGSGGGGSAFNTQTNRDNEYVRYVRPNGTSVIIRYNDNLTASGAWADRATLTYGA